MSPQKASNALIASAPLKIQASAPPERVGLNHTCVAEVAKATEALFGQYTLADALGAGWGAGVDAGAGLGAGVGLGVGVGLDAGAGLGAAEGLVDVIFGTAIETLAFERVTPPTSLKSAILLSLSTLACSDRNGKFDAISGVADVNPKSPIRDVDTENNFIILPSPESGSDDSALYLG